MFYKRPTISEIQNRMAANIDAELGTQAQGLRRTFLGALTYALAGGLYSLYITLENYARNSLPHTAKGAWLDSFASLINTSRRQAQAATGVVTLEGTDGTVLESGAVLKRADGVRFTTDAAATIASGTASVSITCEQKGTIGNTDLLSPLTALSPVIGLKKITVTTELAGGLEIETDGQLQLRVVERWRNPPRGGAKHDYDHWALQSEEHTVDVSKVFSTFDEMGANTVTVRFLVKDEIGLNQIPSSEQVTKVNDYIQSVRPGGPEVFVVAPTAVPVNIEISGLSPNTSAVQQAIEAELKDLFSREAEPGGVLLLTHIAEAISIAAGENDHTLVTPTANTTLSTGQIATYNGVTWS